MNNPVFSVIIPNYNRSSSVQIAIKSVLKQSFSNFEVIVVDDKSTDDSLNELEQIEDPRLNIFQLDKNSGAAAARNFGAKMARGHFLSFLDSDDYYENDFLKESFSLLSKSDPGVGFMWTGVRYHKNKIVYERSWIPERKSNPYLSFLHDHQIGSGSGLSIKKTAFKECGGFDEELPAAEDTDFFLRVTQKFDYTFSTEVLINVIKIGEDRMSKSFDHIATAYNIFLPMHFEVINRDNLLKLKYYYKMMWLNYHLKDKKKARDYYSRIPGSIFQKGKFKTIVTKSLYEIFPLKKASVYHQKISSF